MQHPIGRSYGLQVGLPTKLPADGPADAEDAELSPLMMRLQVGMMLWAACSGPLTYLPADGPADAQDASDDKPEVGCTLLAPLGFPGHAVPSDCSTTGPLHLVLP